MGSFSILNNIAGLNAKNNLILNNANLGRTLFRLSSGRRINTGGDDPAGLQIADSLRANVRALDQASRNAGDGISVAQIADGALQEISNLLTRAVTLAEQAATETTDSTGRSSIQAEFDQIEGEISRIAATSNFNGVALFTTTGVNGSLSIFVGDISNNSSISVTIGTITTSGSTVTNLGGQNLTTIDLTTQGTAATALTAIKNALAGVNASRADVGAGINRLQAAIANLQSQSQNTQAAESAIRDANVAEEVGNLTKFQILAQSGIAALTQANNNQSIVLNLLRQ